MTDVFLFPGEASPDDVRLRAGASGDAVAFPVGVELVLSIGTVTAIGVNARAGAGAWVTAGHDLGRTRRHGHAAPRGVGMQCQVGSVVAHGGRSGIAQPDGVAMVARVGQVHASGVQNLPDDVLAAVLLLMAA